MGALVGLLFVAMGAGVILLAVGWLQTANTVFYAPRWVVGLSGLVFLAGGALFALGAFARTDENGVLLASTPPGLRLATNVLLFAIALLFTIVCAWGALFAPDAHFVDESGAAPSAVELVATRVVAGVMALIAALGAVGVGAEMVRRWRRGES